MQSASEAPEMVGLLAETRVALAHLRADELEALAAKAEEIVSSFADLKPTSAILRREHRLLGDLLAATGENLRVLRRSGASRGGKSRWAL